MAVTQNQKHTYEGLFLFPHAATARLQDAVDEVKTLLTRAEADLISLRKWDERRLAYEIQGNKRGVYFLAYFSAPPENMQGLERNCNLSENLLRSMVTRADHIKPEHIAAADAQEQLADEIKLRAEGENAESTTGSPPAPARG
jgi:small subunit ribosomal protein S6